MKKFLAKNYENTILSTLGKIEGIKREINDATECIRVSEYKRFAIEDLIENIQQLQAAAYKMQTIQVLLDNLGTDKDK